MNQKPNIHLEDLLNDDSFKNWVHESNQNDVAFWKDWIKKHPEHIDEVYTAKAMILGISFKKNSVDTTEINESLQSVLDSISTKPTMKKSAKLMLYTRYALSIAAVGLIIFFSLLNFFAVSGEINYKTGFGEVANIKLQDGTLVTLNGNSALSYHKDEPRNVTLNGEAYFKVKSIPSTKAKFWVNTNDLTVEVYGTEFNVNSRLEKTDVILDEGSINLVFNDGKQKIMKPGEIVSVSSNKETISCKKIEKNNTYAIWKPKTYVFNKKTLESVMKHIENTYGLSVEFDNDSLKYSEISGGIPNENLEICLKAIEKITDVKIEKSKEKLLIYKPTN